SWAWCPPDEGVLPLQAMLQTLRTNGFDDWVSVEDFSDAHTDRQKLARNRALMLEYLQIGDQHTLSHPQEA
ncbi:sugar phosphate isomerase/epimerase, partial [Pseudomonas sp. CCC2.2]|nr:sugar phosphate isomerase/epimerase [Pseudomonas sp. CCC2.2]